MDLIQTAQTFIAQNAWLNQLLSAGIIIILFYGIFRFLMSEKADWIRQKIAPLRILHSSREIKSLINAGEYSKAGDRLIEMKEYERAAEIFQEGKLYSRAGDIYAERKNLPKAVLLYEKSGDLKKVGEIYLKQRNFEKLEELYTRNNKLVELGELFQENKKNRRAAELFFKISEYYRAAENYLQTGDEVKTAEMLEKYFYQMWKIESPEMTALPSKKISEIGIKAGILFEKNEKWDQAIDLYKKIQDKKRISVVLSKKGDFNGAARLAEEAGDFKLAAELHKKTNNDSAAARTEAEYLFQQGDLLNAVEKFKAAGNYSRCADLYGDLQEYIKAAEMHELGGEHYLAGKIYMDEKEYLKAGMNFEKAQYFDEAMVAYREGNFEHKILELMDRTGKYFEMAEYFLSKKLTEQAVAAAEKIPHTDPKFRFGLYILGKIAYERGDYDRSHDLFAESLAQTQMLNALDLNTLHYLALTEQYQNREDFKSMGILETKLAGNLIEPAAMDKAMKILQMIRERSVSRVSHSKSQPFRKPDEASKRLTLVNQNTNAVSERRYITIKEIGRGGMGVVYLAKDQVLDREVALKVLPTSIKSNERVIQTFLREAKSAAGLNHPNIVTVFDTGMQDGDYYIAMEYIDGKTLKKILKKKGKFSYPVVSELLKQLLSALEYAHSKKVIHRDLTTSNIMWTQQKLIKIMDFGLAKVIHNLQSEQSIIGGTPSFMSPEQTVGKPADHRTDIYSLGICIFEMCLGSLPFSKGDLGYHHLHTPPPIPRDIDPAIPPAFNDVILKCMEKKPEDRFQNVGEIVRALSLA